MKKNIDLNLYNIFMKVYDLKSISKAAEELYVSQPSISYSIKELEKQLDVKLFHRRAKGVDPTLEAEKLYYYISNALNIIHIGESTVTESSEEQESVIKIGVRTHVCTCFLSKYIESFLEIYPNVMFEFVDMSTNPMIYMLESKKLDIIIDSLPVKSDKIKLEIKNLKNLDTCFVGKKKFIEKYDELKLTDIEELPFVMPYDTASVSKNLNEYLSQYNIHIKPYMSIWTTEMMKDFVERGMGVGYFIKDSVLDLIKSKEYFCENFNNSLPKVNICLVYIPEFQTYTSKLFCNYLINQINDDLDL